MFLDLSVLCSMLVTVDLWLDTFLPSKAVFLNFLSVTKPFASMLNLEVSQSKMRSPLAHQRLPVTSEVPPPLHIRVLSPPSHQSSQSILHLFHNRVSPFYIGFLITSTFAIGVLPSPLCGCGSMAMGGWSRSGRWTFVTF